MSVINNRQPKFYGPIVGLLLANLFAKSVLAKYAPFGAVKFSYEPNSWLPFNRPVDPYFYQHQQNSLWHPIVNGGNHQIQPLTTTPPPYVHEEHDQPQIINIYEAPDGEIPTNIESPDHHYHDDLIPAESNLRHQRLPAPRERYSVPRTTDRPGRRRGYNNNRYVSRRKPYHTTPQYYYDSFEDYTNRYNSKRKTFPKVPVHSYEFYDENNLSQSDYYNDESEETTTKRMKSKRRTTQKPKISNRKKTNKNRKRPQKIVINEDSDEYDDSGEQTTIRIRPRQGQTTTTEGTTTDTTTEGSSTTKAQATVIVNGTTTANSTNTTGYGYGPSNGNEGISFTYGPSAGNFIPQGYGPPKPSYGPPQQVYGTPGNNQYLLPYSDWYSNEITRNAIVKKVHDIIGFDGNIYQQNTP